MITLIDNPYGLDIEDFFIEGKRLDNEKRSQIILSKVTGRYISTDPSLVKKSGELLSLTRTTHAKSIKEYWDNGTFCIPILYEPNTLVIGLADAAVGLGMAVAETIKGCRYISSTKCQYNTVSELTRFEEVHSLSPTQHLYDSQFVLNEFSKLVIVEDEITTGNTILSLLKSIKRKLGCIDCDILTILDNRSIESEDKFNKEIAELGMKVDTLYLFKCRTENTSDIIDEVTMSITDRTSEVTESKMLSLFPRCLVSTVGGKSYPIIGTGKFGLSEKEMNELEFLSYLAANKISEDLSDLQCESLLVLGSMENSYIPSRIASALDEMGYCVDFNTIVQNKITSGSYYTKYCTDCSIDGKTRYLYTDESLERYDMVITIIDDVPIQKLCENFISYTL